MLLSQDAEVIPVYSRFFLSATPTSGIFVRSQVWRVMQSLHPRPLIWDALHCLCCRKCHMTMDPEGDHRPGAAIVVSVAGGLGLRISRSLLSEKVYARSGSTVLSRFHCSSLTLTNDLVICLHSWTCHPLRTLRRAKPRLTSPSVLHALLLVGGMRGRSPEERLQLLSRRSAVALRINFAAGANAAGTWVSTFYMDFRPLSFEPIWRTWRKLS
jgi:hypothetical protein